MIGWLVALVLYAIGVRSLHVASQGDPETEEIPTGMRLAIIFAWPLLELQDWLFPEKEEDDE